MMVELDYAEAAVKGVTRTLSAVRITTPGSPQDKTRRLAASNAQRSEAASTNQSVTPECFRVGVDDNLT